MSHFALMVVTRGKPSNESLEQLLAPFEEETNDPRFLEFIPTSDDDLEYERSSWEKYGKNCSFEEYSGFFYNEEVNKWGHFGNPNIKWDYWVTGGRWGQYLLLKNGTRGYRAFSRDIDFRKMKDNLENLYSEIWEEIINDRLVSHPIERLHRYGGVYMDKKELLKKYENKETFIKCNSVIFPHFLKHTGEWVEKSKTLLFGFSEMSTLEVELRGRSQL